MPARYDHRIGDEVYVDVGTASVISVIGRISQMDGEGYFVTFGGAHKAMWFTEANVTPTVHCKINRAIRERRRVRLPSG